MDQIEVFPLKDGTWNWRLRKNDKSSKTGDGYELRRDAIRAARDFNGGEEINLVRQDGSFAGRARIGDSKYRVVLLRLDGSLYGELDAAPGSTGQVQHVTLTPATESADAGQED